MNFTGFEKKYSNFYNPSYEIRVEGTNLQQKGLEITSVKVDHTLKAADYFSFDINNLYDLGMELKPLLPVGKKISIRMGYGGRLEPVLSGVITSISTRFQATGRPQLTVTGYDLSYPLMKGMSARSWDKVKHSDIAAFIAQDYGLKFEIDSTDVIFPKVMKQSGQSDFQFLQKLAEDNYFEFFVFDETLYFRKPQRDSEPSLELEWGRQLLSFQSEIDITKQVTEVEVRGWNPKTKKEISGKAKAASAGIRNNAGNGLIYDVLREPVKLSLRQPVHSQQEAEKLASSILKQHAEGLIEGTGETFGIPEILPGRTIRLLGLGDTFSKNYYIEKSVHSMSSSGYKTTFHVKESVR